MNKSIVFSTLLFSSFLYGYEAIETSSENNNPVIKSPEEIKIEIDQAQRDFEIASKIFIPWYTGPLIASSANNVPPMRVNIQPYLYLKLTHAEYDNNRRSADISNISSISPLFIFQLGLTNWLDFTTAPQGNFQWQKSSFGAAFNDLPVQFGFQICHETPYIPSIRFVLGELFPTGKYQNLNPERLGLDSGGAGAYQTIFGLNISKVFWWFKLNPIAFRFASSYNAPNCKVSVENHNTYGGGNGTKGKVDVGQTLNLDLGIELSINQKWVFATDLCYTSSQKSTFKGKNGITAEGLVASVGTPSSDQLSLAPAIEYNINENSGFIGGLWFTATGRNSANFLQLVLSYTALF
jgi:hypothetical protein